MRPVPTDAMDTDLAVRMINALVTRVLTASPPGPTPIAQAVPAPRQRHGLARFRVLMMLILWWSAVTRACATASPASASALPTTKALPASVPPAPTDAVMLVYALLRSRWLLMLAGRTIPPGMPRSMLAAFVIWEDEDPTALLVSSRLLVHDCLGFRIAHWYLSSPNLLLELSSHNIACFFYCAVSTPTYPISPPSFPQLNAPLVQMS